MKLIPTTILLPIEGVDSAVSAIHWLSQFGKKTEIELILLHVWEEIPFTPSYSTYYKDTHEISYQQAAEEHAELALDAAQETATSHGLFVRSRRVRHGVPSDTILAVAEECNADWIVMGTHQRRGISRWVMGSVAQKVACAATIPVLSVPPAG